MVEEHDGVLVHRSEFEPEHPQEDNPSTHRADAEALKIQDQIGQSLLKF